MTFTACNSSNNKQVASVVIPTKKASIVKALDVVLLESFPIQVNLIAKVRFPDECTHISEVTQERDKNQFIINISTVRYDEKSCPLKPTTYEEIIPLDVENLKAGYYTVKVNDVQGSFELLVDN